MFLNQEVFSKPRVDGEFTGYLDMNLYRPAFDFKQHWMSKWFVYRQMYNGCMWDNIETPEDFIGILNVTKPTTISILSELLSLDRTIKLTSHTLQGVYRADKMQTFLKQEQDAGRFAKEFGKVQLEKILTGGSFYKLMFKEDALVKVSPDYAVDGSNLLPVGRVEAKFVRPELVFPEPKRGTLEECGYVVEIETVRLSDIVRRYDLPEEVIKELVKRVSNDSRSNLYRDIEKQVRSNNHPVGFGKFLKSIEPCSKYDRELWLMHAYIKDDAVIEYDIDVQYGEKNYIVQFDRKKYPNGRIITWYGDIVIEDVSNPYDFTNAVGHNYPFVYEKFESDADSRVFWGVGKVESMLGTNIDINYIYSQLLSQIGLMGNPQWLAERGAVYDPDDLDNRIGRVIETAPGAVSNNKIVRKPGLPPDQGTFNFLLSLIELFDKQTGRVDVTQGVNPKGVNTFRGIVSLLESANKKLIPVFVEMDTAMSELGKMMLCIIADFYEGIDRVVTVQDKSSEPGLKEFVIRAIAEDKYSYMVRVGSLASKVKDQAQIQMLSFLAQTGAVDTQTLLEEMDIENVSEIIDRMKAAEAAKAEQQRQLIEAQSKAQTQQAVTVENQRGRNAMAEQLMKMGGQNDRQ